MRLILLFSFLFFSELKAQDDFGFVYSWGHIHSYNSFNNTYTKSICRDIEPYKVQLTLEKDTILDFEKKTRKNRFLVY